MGAMAAPHVRFVPSISRFPHPSLLLFFSLVFYKAILGHVSSQENEFGGDATSDPVLLQHPIPTHSNVCCGRTMAQPHRILQPFSVVSSSGWSSLFTTASPSSYMCALLRGGSRTLFFICITPTCCGGNSSEVCDGSHSMLPSNVHVLLLLDSTAQSVGKGRFSPIAPPQAPQILLTIRIGLRD